MTIGPVLTAGQLGIGRQDLSHDDLQISTETTCYVLSTLSKSPPEGGNRKEETR